MPGRTRSGPGWVAVTMLAAVCAARAGDRVPDGDPVELLRSAPAAALTVVEGPKGYAPSTLFEILDGGAPLYLDYGFVAMARVRFGLDDAPGSLVTVDVFDMGTPLGAFGVFRSIRPEAAPDRAWGAEGYRDGRVAAAWKGRIYVHAEADADSQPLAAAMEAEVAHLVDAVHGTTVLPRMLDRLPRGGLVQGTERWVARDLLGHAFLPDGLVATYELGGDRATLFLSELDSASAAAVAARRLRAHLTRRGAVATPDEVGGAAGFRFQAPDGSAGIVVAAGAVVAGVRGRVDGPEAERLLAELLSRLGPP